MKKVLVVDDTKNIRMILTKCLELEGYEVMTASDGRKALDLLTVSSFDLVFLDIKLPEISGTEVLRRIRDIGVKTPVVIITAYATVKNAVDCTNMGAVKYMQKPFSTDKIKSLLNELNSVFTTDIGAEVDLLIRNANLSITEKEYAKALTYSKKALSLELELPEIYLIISKAYEGLGESKNAERFLWLYKSYL